MIGNRLQAKYKIQSWYIGGGDVFLEAAIGGKGIADLAFDDGDRTIAEAYFVGGIDDRV